MTNYGDISHDGRRKVLNEAMNDIYVSSKNDVDIIGTLFNVGVVERVDVVNSIIRTTGKDGFIVNAGIAAAGAKKGKISILFCPPTKSNPYTTVAHLMRIAMLLQIALP